MRAKKNSRGLKLSALAVIAAAIAPVARSQTVSDWTGLDSNGLWNDAANWDDGVPISGFTATFNSYGNGFTNVDLGGANQAVGNIVFDGTPTSYNLGISGGDTFTFDANGAITVNSNVSNGQMIYAAINTTGSMAVTNNGASSLTLGGNVLISGGGVLTVSSASDNTTQLNGNITDTGGAGSVAYTLNAGGSSSPSNIFINGNNSYSGTTTINVNTDPLTGGIQVGSDSAFSSGKIIINGGTSTTGLLLANNGTRTLTNAIDLNSSVTLSGPGDFNLNGPINVISSGGATVRVITTFLTGGAVSYGASTSSASTITLGNPISNGGDDVGQLLAFGAANNETTNINAVLQNPGTGSGSVGYVGATGAVFNVNNLNTYSGQTIFGGSSGSTVRFNNDYTGGASGPFGTGTLVFSNTSSASTLAPTGGGTRTLANPIQFLGGANFANVVGDNTSLLLSGPISFGTSSVTVLNSLTPGNTLTYGATLNSQTITLPASGTGLTTLINGPGVTIINDAFAQSGTFVTLLNLGGNSSTGTMTINGSLAGIAGSNLQFAGATNTNTGAIGTINFNTTFSGTGSINISSSGAIFINTQSTFSGGANFGGTLALVTTFTTSTTGSPGSVTSGPFGVGTITFSGGNNNSTLRPAGGDQVLANAFLLSSGPVFANAPADTSSLALTGNIALGSAGRNITNSFGTNSTLTLGAATSPATLTLSTNSGQTLSFMGSGTTIINDIIQNAGTVAGAVAFGNSNNGSVIVNSVNTYTGNTTFSGSNGVTSFNHSTTGTSGAIVSGPFGTGTMIFNNTTSAPHLRPTGGDQTLSNPITVTSNFIVEDAPGDNSSLTLLGNLTLGNSGRTITNNFNGSSGAVLTLGAATSPATITLPSNANGQTLAFAGSGMTIINDNFAQNGTSRQNIQFNAGSAGTIIVNGNLPTGGNLTLSGVTTATGVGENVLNTPFGGTGGVNIGGNDIHVLNAQSTYSGLTTITGGNNGAIIKIPLSSVMSGTSVVSGPFGVGTMQFNSVGIPRVCATGGDQTVGNAIQLLQPLVMDNDIGDTSSLTFTGAIAMGTNSTFIANGFTAVASAGTLTLGAAATPSTITVTATNSTGAQTLAFNAFNGPIVVNDAILDGSQMGNIGINTGTSAADLGTVTFAGNNTYTGSTTVNAGVLQIAANSSPGAAGGALNVADNASMVFLPGASAVTRTFGNVNLNSLGKLDVGNSSFYTTTSTSTIQSYLKAGYNGGAWNGSGAAIVSTSANLSSGSSTRSLGYASSTDSVAGSVVIPAGQTLVKYTTPGDADLSGNTDFNDFLALQNAYNKPGDWSQGDFDYTGTVDFNDFLILQNNYNHSLNANGTVAGGSAKSALAKTSSLTASPSVPTATVTYVLSPNDDGHGNNAPGKFAVYAIDSTADGNHGMASFSVDVQGATLVTNFAPKGTYDDGTNTGNTVAEGFTLLRTGNGAFSTLTDPAKSSQDTVDASGVQLIYGMGQLAGNLNSQAPAGSSGGTGKVQPTYAAELLVMTGTFSGSSLAFNTDMTFDKANVFLTGSTADTEAAGITLTTAGVPEPTTLSLMALAAGGLLGRRKRRH